MNALGPADERMGSGRLTAGDPLPAVARLARSFGLPRALDFEIPRLRLVRLLEGRWDRPVTLLVAGPGFGKTTVLAQAVRAHQAAPRGIDVWLSCEAAYEDPVCFATALLDALSADGRAREPGRRVAPGPREIVGALISRAPLEAYARLARRNVVPARRKRAAVVAEGRRSIGIERTRLRPRAQSSADGCRSCQRREGYVRAHRRGAAIQSGGTRDWVQGYR